MNTITVLDAYDAVFQGKGVEHLVEFRLTVKAYEKRYSKIIMTMVSPREIEYLDDSSYIGAFFWVEKLIALKNIQAVNCAKVRKDKFDEALHDEIVIISMNGPRIRRREATRVLKICFKKRKAKTSQNTISGFRV